MTFTVTVTQKPSDISAVWVDQTYATRTSGPVIGTSKLFNCLGIVVHCNDKKMGCVAHVEAQTEVGTYLEHVASALAEMQADLKKNGVSGPVHVVLLGNAGGMGAKEKELHDVVFKCFKEFNLTEDTYTDVRNIHAFSDGQDAKGQKLKRVGSGDLLQGKFAGCAYDPVKETLVLNQNTFQDFSYSDAVSRKVKCWKIQQ